MKQLSLLSANIRFFIFILLLPLFFIFSSRADAAEAHIGPDGVWPVENGKLVVTAGDPRLQFIIERCPVGNEVRVEWALKVGGPNTSSQKVISRSNNPIIITPGGINVFNSNTLTTDYWWRYYCADPRSLPTPNLTESNLPWVEAGSFTVKAINKADLHFDYQPKPALARDPRVKLIVTGCPLNSEVFLEWNLLNQNPNAINRRNNFRSDAKWDGDRAIVTSRNGFSPGEYGVMAECGGIRKNESDDDSFKFIIEDKVVTPTMLPSPPPPVCEEFQDGGCFKVNTAIGPIFTKPDLFILSLFRLLLGLTGGIGVLVIIYAGYLIITSNGKAEQLQKGRELLLSALIGFLFIVLSFVILEVLTVDILHLPGFEKTVSNPCGTRPGPC